LRVFCLLAVVATTTAWADPSATDKAQAAQTAAEQRSGQLATQRAQLTARYQDELGSIDRLKKQKASWRRDRELNTAQADAKDTADKLATLDKQIATAQQTVGAARAAVLKAIDTELPTATGPRAQALTTLRAQLAPSKVVKKIVIPDANIDPLADPDELEHQAAALRDSEDALAKQVKSLETQQTELEHVAEIRKQHERAGDLAMREDDAPHRNAQTSASKGLTDSSAPPPQAGGGANSPAGDHSGGTGTTGGTSTGGDQFIGGDRTGYESEASVVLGEVVDRSTIEGMMRASRSGDPAQRAVATKQAKDAVAARLEQLKKQRAAIEARAKALRAQPH
jgi:hypothetical protein